MLTKKYKVKPSTRGSHLQSQLLGRLRSAESRFKASLGKQFVRPAPLQNNQNKWTGDIRNTMDVKELSQ
jgi:hypothetical protein